MTTIDMRNTQTFAPALMSSGRSPEIPESADVYGWLVGDWELDVIHYWISVADRGLKGELHATWALEGRAVQDVWIMPRISERKAGIDKTTNMYGTTLRVWDASIQSWRITWTDPLNSRQVQQIGQWSGKDIVQIGCYANGTPSRWRFTEITRDSFHWSGDSLEPDGKTWKLNGEFLGQTDGLERIKHIGTERERRVPTGSHKSIKEAHSCPSINYENIWSICSPAIRPT